MISIDYFGGGENGEASDEEPQIAKIKTSCSRYKAKFLGSKPSGLAFCKVGKGVAKTEATERRERVWALFQRDWAQNQPHQLLAVCPQASYLASPNTGALSPPSTMSSVPCSLHREQL